MLNNRIIQSIVKITKEAGEIAVSSRKSADFRVEIKSDGTKVSSSDILVDEFLHNSLGKIIPGVNIISEESDPSLPISLSGYCFMIDPIDGTSNFCKNGDEFTVNIALFKDGEAIFGIIHAPLYKGGKTSYVDENGNLVIESCDQDEDFDDSGKNIIVASKSVSNEIIEKFVEKYLYYEENSYIIKKMSSSVKFFEILEGKSDFFLMLHNTSEWDVAAGHYLVNASNGFVDEIDNNDGLRKLEYFKKDFLNNNLIISSNYGKKIGIKL